MTDEKRNSVIERIKKLFALGGNNPNENECALAIAKAQELMNQYNVENIDLIKNNATDIVVIDFEVQTRFNEPTINLAVAIGHTFNLKPILVKSDGDDEKIHKKIRFIGDKTDIAFGSFVFSYMLSIATTKGEEYFESVRYKKVKWSPIGAKKAKTDFAFGFVEAVKVKLEALKKQREEENLRNHPNETGMSIYNNDLITAIALVKTNRIEDFINENLGKLKDRPEKEISQDEKAFGKGYTEGEKTSISRGIEGNSNNEPKLLSAW